MAAHSVHESATMTLDAALVWFCRDLRSFHHAALSHALRAARRVWCVFVFDREILDLLPRRDRRVEFIHHAIGELHAALLEAGGGLIVEHGRAQELIPRLAQRLSVDRVVAARDYEPAACARDQAVSDALRAQGRELLLVKDQAIFDTGELLTAAGAPYSVSTPYRRAWLARLLARTVTASRWLRRTAGACGTACISVCRRWNRSAFGAPTSPG